VGPFPANPLRLGAHGDVAPHPVPAIATIGRCERIPDRTAHETRCTGAACAATGPTVPQASRYLHQFVASGARGTQRNLHGPRRRVATCSSAPGSSHQRISGRDREGRASSPLRNQPAATLLRSRTISQLGRRMQRAERLLLSVGHRLKRKPLAISCTGAKAEAGSRLRSIDLTSRSAVDCAPAFDDDGPWSCRSKGSRAAHDVRRLSDRRRR
jgi:hypothetical protein